MLTHELQDFAEQGKCLAVPDTDLPGLLERQLGDGPDAGQLGVVMHHESPIPGDVDVQLHAVTVQHDGTPERRSRVLIFIS